MNELEQKLIMRIRESNDPDQMMDYVEMLLFSPQKFQEALEELSALRES